MLRLPVACVTVSALLYSDAPAAKVEAAFPPAKDLSSAYPAFADHVVAVAAAITTASDFCYLVVAAANVLEITALSKEQQEASLQMGL